MDEETVSLTSKNKKHLIQRTTVYLRMDEDTVYKLKIRAKKKNLSLNEYLCRILKKTANNETIESIHNSYQSTIEKFGAALTSLADQVHDMKLQTEAINLQLTRLEKTISDLK